MKMKEYRKIPRGLRNCNPLNIRKSNGTKWVGQIGDDGTFCVFEDVVHGLRAAFRLLRWMPWLWWNWAEIFWRRTC